MRSESRGVGVVGASGFIGRALVEQLVNDGRRPLRLFGRRTGEASGIAIEAVDITPECFRGLECIVHLSGITTSRASSASLQRVNVDLTSQVANAAASAGVKRMVFISSLHVHGKSASTKIGPGAPLKPDNAYGKSKAAAESIVRTIAAETGLEVVILRPPMVYGAGAKGSFKLLTQLVRTGLPLPFGSARGSRSLCSVGNLVSAIQFSIEATTPPSVLIPADPEDFDTPALVKTISSALGRPARLWPIPKALLAVPLAAIGRAEMIVSLFESLRVDRSHWLVQNWHPPETGREAVRAALSDGARPPRLLLYVTNSTPYFFSHRISFAREATRRGFTVALAGADVDQHLDQLQVEGILPLAIPGAARGVNPFGDMRASFAIAHHIRRLRVQVVHATGLKAMFLCAIARLIGPMPRVVCVVTGLGSTYIRRTLPTYLMRLGIEAALRPLLRRSLTSVVFQNEDDRRYFLQRGVAQDHNSLIIRGSGVDTSEYTERPEPRGGLPLVVFPARLLKSKGVREFSAAATMLKAKGIKARFALVGDLDPANPDALMPDELSKLAGAGDVEVWGFRSDMAAVFASSHIVCLPSYREGLPKALIEAASVGRAIVTTDVPGCREVVHDGLNGLLVPARDSHALAKALESLLLDPARRRRMGLASRSLVESEFSMETVVGATVDLYANDRCVRS